MDSSRFDELTKGLAAIPSRRSIVATVAALGIAAFGAPLSDKASERALARKRKKRKKRKKKKPAGTGCQRQCGDAACGDDGCGGTCGECETGERCRDGLCVCEPSCGGKACGDDGCGNSCGTCHGGDTCQDGACVCSTPGGLGPGEICTSAAECCPYSGEEICSKGSGFCETFLPVCRSGFGGKCSGNCDCRGNLECRNGTCRCPEDRGYLGNGLCCGEGLTRCGDICCHGPGDCLCFPGIDCRCKTLPG